jgi:hypothetical protein
MALPAGHGLHEAAGLVLRVFALDHLADRAAPHQAADLDRGGVGPRIAHPAAHVGVEGEVDHPQQNLAVLERRQFGLGHPKGLDRRGADRAFGQQDLGGFHDEAFRFRV